MSMIVFRAELRRTVHEARYYWIHTISSIVSTIVFYLGFSFSIPGIRLDAFFLLSMLLWYYSLEITNQMSHYILEEKFFGTIEKIFLSPFGPLKVLSARALSSLAVSSLSSLAMFVVLSTALGISPFGMPAATLVVFGLTLVGLYGFGLMLAGLTLLNARTSSVSGIIVYVMLFMSGMILPLDSFPEGLAVLARLLPLTIGVDNMRFLTSTGPDQWLFLVSLRFLSGVLYSLGAVFLGVFLFGRGVRTAKNKGLLRVA